MTACKLLVLSWLFLALSASLSAGVIGGTDVRIGANAWRHRCTLGDPRLRCRLGQPTTPSSSGMRAGPSTSRQMVAPPGIRRYRYTTARQAMAALDMAASGAWVYVGYTCSMPDQVVLAKMRRFALDTGDLDTGYTNGGELVADTSLATVVDIAVETNVDSDDDQDLLLPDPERRHDPSPSGTSPPMAPNSSR